VEVDKKRGPSAGIQEETGEGASTCLRAGSCFLPALFRPGTQASACPRS